MTERGTDGPTFLYEFEREGDVRSLLEFLEQSEKPTIRVRTAEILGGLTQVQDVNSDEEITTGLITAVREDTDDRVRVAAIDALYLRNDLEVLIDALETACHDGSSQIESQLMVQWLSSAHPEFRLVGAGVIGRLGDRSKTPILCAQFSDIDARVRARAVQACGELGDSRAVPPVAGRLTDRNPTVQRNAAMALGAIGTQAALEALLPATRTDNLSLRKAATIALGSFERREAIDELAALLTDQSHTVRQIATSSLLQALSESPPEQSDWIRSTIADRLQKGENPAIATELIDILETETEKTVRRNAIWLLGNIADTSSSGRIHQALVAALADNDEMVAQTAMAALNAFEDAESKKRLQLFVQETESETARSRAKLVLEKQVADPPRDVVKQSVTYSYVTDPSEYTTSRPDIDDSSS